MRINTAGSTALEAELLIILAHPVSSFSSALTRIQYMVPVPETMVPVPEIEKTVPR